MPQFLALGLAEPITRALADEQYTSPTPIQAQTIPQALAARDIVGIAQTGTGKTAAFALPILHRLAAAPRRCEPRRCRVLVLSPTRELSAQIVESFTTYGRYLHPRVALAIGGVSLNPQIRALASGVDILVATPGRLLDLMAQRAITLDGIETFVLDEADRMLDMGFIHDIRKIVAKLPRQRQTLFFSATMPREIAELAAQMLRDPVKVAVTPAATTVERIAQRVIHVERAGKPSLLAELLRQENSDRVLVFTRTKRGADKVVRGLAKDGLAAEAIHGNKSQNQRERVLNAFRAGSVRTLVATDIAARGIDVEGISHVINYDLPNVPESYVHRIGRTARAGADGVAISFCDTEERPLLRDIEKVIRMNIPASDHRGGRRAQPVQHANGAQHRPAQNKPAQHRHAQDRPAQGKPAQGKPAQSKSGHTQHGRRHGQSRNGHTAHNGHNGHKAGAPRQAPQRNGAGAPASRNAASRDPAATHGGDIGAVAFMRTPRRPGAPSRPERRAPR